VAKILRGDPVFLKSLALAGQRVFQIESPLELLHPEELQRLGVQTEVPSPGQVLEWEIEEYVSGWQETSNGLQYQLVRLRHRYLDNRWARGKCYELRHLPAADRERLEHYLLRHVEVCERVSPHPHIVNNLTAAYVGDLWWVLDAWEEGDTLARRLEEGPLTEYELRLVMTGIARGLQALHRAYIIRRELSPRFVLLRECDDRPILTDLELAKLCEGVPTVSPQKWPEDPYRALEVGGDAPIDERADLYSWGRIFVHAAEGSLSARGTERLSDPRIPEPVRQAVLQAVATARSERPADIDAVLAVMKAWP
jgi:serine/threonine protein kinase